MSFKFRMILLPKTTNTEVTSMCYNACNISTMEKIKKKAQEEKKWWVTMNYYLLNYKDD